MKGSNIDDLKNIFDIFRESPGHLYLKGKDGKWLACNLEKARSVGASFSDEVIGKTDFDFFPHDDALAIEYSDVRAMNSNSASYSEESYRFEGSKKVFLSYKTPIKNKDGKVEGLFVTAVEVKDSKKEDDKDLLMYITHEIKTPLACMLKMSNLLYDNWDKYQDDNARKEHLRIAVEGNNRLQNVLLNILDLSKIKTGKMAYEMEIYSLKDSVMDVANEFIDDRSRINIECKNDSNFYGYYDHYRIEQVIRNLVANSITYGGSGVITITLEETDDGKIICNISDEGIGIPDKETESIFEIFNQSSRTKGNKNGVGIGVGLAICKNIISDHKGKIGVFNNNDGKGCTFFFSINSVDVIASHKKSKQVIARKKENTSHRPVILLIDNEYSILEITSLVLESIGFDVIPAKSGQQGLQILKDRKEDIDLVLLDLIMPDIDGLDLLETIRKDDSLKDVVVFIHSSNIGDKNSVERANRLGVKCFVDKTLSAEKIAILLSDFLLEA